MEGTVFNNPMDIEERLDPSTGKPYFYHRRSRKTAWSREDLLLESGDEMVSVSTPMHIESSLY
jgi:hypothetical protein